MNFTLISLYNIAFLNVIVVRFIARLQETDHDVISLPTVMPLVLSKLPPAVRGYPLNPVVASGDADQLLPRCFALFLRVAVTRNNQFQHVRSSAPWLSAS